MNRIGVTSFRITPETQRKLREHCEAHGLIVGAFVDAAIRAHIENGGENKTIREIVREEMKR